MVLATRISAPNTSLAVIRPKPRPDSPTASEISVIMLKSELPHEAPNPVSKKTMSNIDAELARLIAPGRVHRRLYTDPAIFELEMERIFDAAWVYVGHESQIKKPGDYFAPRRGRKPVVLVRDDEGQVRVIHNQCAHRGAMVVATDKGNTAEFICCYHGWTYHLDGRVKAVPLNHGYPQGFDPKDPKLGMLPVPRVKSYRGFIFASGASDGPSLEESLGHMTTSLDDMVDRAPDGEIEVAGGVFKHAYDGNWKVYFENLCD